MALITKIEIARRELDAAITMYFQYGDPLVIYLCFMSAYKICRDLNRDGDESITREFGETIEKFRNLSGAPVRADIWNLMDAKYNILKHGRDRDEKVDLIKIIAETEFFMLLAVIEFRSVSGNFSDPMEIFLKAWDLRRNGKSASEARRELAEDPDCKRRILSSLDRDRSTWIC
ncbi:hypothetical protein [Methylobacterium fujisawaense]|uniref:hypothetical protein n=1 Tax=Methylobacterium fujisawaense TaxID=107400 RepID=UPI00313CFFEE